MRRFDPYGLRSILATVMSSREMVALSRKEDVAFAMARHPWINFWEKRT
jgi:hypothetical protein